MRSATSVTPSVKELSHAPMPALIFSRVSTRWAALTAFSTLSPASASRRTILAPPERLDAALAVDLLDGHLRAHLLELALAGPAPGQRHDQRDLDVVGRRHRRHEERGDEEDDRERGDRAREKRHHCLLPERGRTFGVTAATISLREKGRKGMFRPRLI